MNNLHKSKINNNILIQESAGHTVEERLNYDKNVDCKKFLKAFTKQFELVQEGCSEKKIRLSAQILQHLGSLLGDDVFVTALISHSLPILQAPSGSGSSIGRLMHLIALTIVKPHTTTKENALKLSNEDDLNPSAVGFITFCLKNTESQSKQVRLRSCELLNFILQACEDYEISSYLFDTIAEIMMIRAYDKNPSIRIQALKLLARVQDPIDENSGTCGGWNDLKNPITEIFVNLVSSDNSPEVRKTALELMPPSVYTLPVFLRRCYDVKDVVRLAAFRTLGQRVAVSDLTRTARLQLVKSGLSDRSSHVVAACRQMLCNWLTHQNECCLTLLHFFHVESHEEVSVDVLKAIFVHSDQHFTIKNLKLDGLNSEGALYWRVLCQHVLATDSNREIEVLPTLSDLCDLLLHYKALFFHSDESNTTTKQTITFIMRQLLFLASNLDASDEVGRQRLTEEVERLVVSLETFPMLMEPLVRCIERLHPSVTARTSTFFQLLDQTAKGAPSSHPEKLRAFLELSVYFFEGLAVIPTTEKPVAAYLESIVLVLRSGDPELRLLSLRNLGLYCLSDWLLSRQYLPWIKQILESDLRPIRVVALKLLCDLVLKFALQPPTPFDDFPDSFLNDQLALLDKYLSSSEKEEQAVAVEGVAKVLIHSASNSVDLLAKLLLLYFDSSTEGNTRLRQSLSVFFPVFALSSLANQELVARSFLYLLSSVFSGSSRPIFSAVRIIDLAQYIVHLTHPSNLLPLEKKKTDEASNCHDFVLIELLSDLVALKISNYAAVKASCKALTLLQYCSASHARLALQLVTRLQCLQDKACSAYLLKFKTNLQLFVSNCTTQKNANNLIIYVRAETYEHLQPLLAGMSSIDVVLRGL
ncbi:uncharacterized protein LOC135145958 isoform X2 [Zophobas morio]|uniref:uncharacterized protein LOC135145958 isoform X2 n=1 Tax=Zophobas morio TaxID=2755281 RepID=UPI0030832F97